MGQLARSQVSQAKQAFAERNVDLAYDLVARCLERIGDNAVDIGEQTLSVHS